MASAISPPDATVGEHYAHLRVSMGGPLQIATSGSYHWRIVDRSPMVAFLTTSLFGLGTGERLSVRTRVDRAASLVLTGQGPTALMRTRELCQYSFRAELGPGANLTYLPWTTIPFRGSRTAVETNIALAPGASFIGWDILSTGRVSSGEDLTLDVLRSRFAIRSDRLLIDERLELLGTDRELLRAALGTSTHIGTLYAAGPAHQLPAVAAIRRVASGVAVSRPDDELLVAKALGSSAERVERSLWPAVQVIRDAMGLEQLAPGAVARRWLGSGSRAPGESPAFDRSVDAVWRGWRSSDGHDRLPRLVRVG